MVSEDHVVSGGRVPGSAGVDIGQDVVAAHLDGSDFGPRVSVAQRPQRLPPCIHSVVDGAVPMNPGH
eukprot:11209890-Lingulodinium_polyedra.AAC.1